MCVYSYKKYICGCVSTLYSYRIVVMGGRRREGGRERGREGEREREGGGREGGREGENVYSIYLVSHSE